MVKGCIKDKFCQLMGGCGGDVADAFLENAEDPCMTTKMPRAIATTIMQVVVEPEVPKL
jgi:hypothetical protein